MHDEEFLPDKKTVARRLLCVIFCAIFLILAVGIAYLFFHNPTGAGVDTAAPMKGAAQNMNTGAMIDPNREIRGIWVPSVLNITYPSKQTLTAKELRAELDDIVKTARESGLNTICFQVRPSADALYDSDIFPTSAYLSGTQGEPADDNFDPLAYLCEIASGDGTEDAIAVYAWVNPLRVTSAGQDVSLLSSDNPAVLHPEWTFTYNNALYFNAGLLDVRALVAAGVKEICEKYPVAGIIFDDYFYPYPVTGADGSILPIPDEDTYALYGSDFETVGDFRRDSVNQMVKACYDAVKEVNPYLQFGVAPFGIWQNDNGIYDMKNNARGSETAGLEAYSAIYCDALAWMRGGYIDFIAPQIYWQFTTSVARYDTLVRWWNAQCDRYDIPLWISHAIHTYETWNNPGEMRNQVTFARAENKYRGSLYFGYPQLYENTLGIADELRGLYENEILYFEKAVTDTAPMVHITNPPHNSRFDAEGTFIMGQSDPSLPLYCDGEVVSRTAGGYFVLYRALENGENTFVFMQGETVYEHTVWCGRDASLPDDGADTAPDTKTDSTTATDTTAPLPLTATVDYPTSLAAVPAKSGLWVSVSANAGAMVMASVGDGSAILTEASADGTGMATYTGTVPLPACDAGQYVLCGNLLVTVSKDGYAEGVSVSGTEIYARGDGATVPVTVTKDGAFLKTAPDSWYYDDYIPQAVGMTVAASEIYGGFARFSLAGNTAYLDVTDLAIAPDATVGMAMLGVLTTEETEQTSVLRIPADINVPVHSTKNGDIFTLTLYRAQTTEELGAVYELDGHPLFRNYTVSAGGNEENAYVTYTFTLNERDRFYGFAVSYEDGNVCVTLRNPVTLDTDSATPLTGKTIVLDAGHGGTDPGALTPGSHRDMSEKDCNLAIVLAAKERLTALGADVIVLRETDETLDIYARMEKVNAIDPDLLLSIHQNSMPQSSDITHIRGVVGLYWTESGRSLADCVSTELSVALGRLKRDTASQRLAMLRNYKFPSALIEVGFVTNPEEFETLVSAQGIEKAAGAICDGILKWYREQK